MEGWVSRSCYWSVFPLSFSFNLTYLTLLRMLDVADVTKSFVNHVQTSLARQAYNLGMSLPSYPSLFASSSPFLAPFLHTLPLVMKKGTLISTQSRQSRRISSCGSFGPGQSSCASSLPPSLSPTHPLTLLPFLRLLSLLLSPTDGRYKYRTCLTLWLMQLNWNATQQEYTKKTPKRAYYLSLEFLMGRTLDNAVSVPPIASSPFPTLPYSFGASNES